MKSVLSSVLPRPWGDLKVLIVGCGNSSFSYEIWKDGVGDVVSLDYSEVVVEKMREKYGEEEDFKVSSAGRLLVK